MFKELEFGDLVELFYDKNSRYVLSDEFCIIWEDNTFVIDEDSGYFNLDSITKVWRDDINGDYALIYSKI